MGCRTAQCQNDMRRMVALQRALRGYLLQSEMMQRKAVARRVMPAEACASSKANMRFCELSGMTEINGCKGVDPNSPTAEADAREWRKCVLTHEAKQHVRSEDRQRVLREIQELKEHLDDLEDKA